MHNIITGIQQIGIGVTDVHKAWKWYRQNFGMDIRVFEEAAEAGLMLKYTGGKPRERHAVLALNLQGGSGFEIWQYTKRSPKAADFEIQLGDLGIVSARIKAKDVEATYRAFKKRGLKVLGELEDMPNGPYKHFFVYDPENNLFEITGHPVWFRLNRGLTGGPTGAMIGVSDIDKALNVYRDILGYDTILYDISGIHDDLKSLPGGNRKLRRVMLADSKVRSGVFSRLFGPSQIELIQALDRKPKKIYENRYWGDLGFIHLCFDINNMSKLRETCKAKGFPFTVDSSSSFDMGEAAGHFAYIADADGTLIEFVETHRIPIIKKLGWYINLKKRKPNKPLPNWIIRAMSSSRVKD